MNSFITGSHAYGKPTEKSDIDLVLLLEPEVTQFLIENSDDMCIPCRFGKLNLVLCKDEREFTAWRIITDNLKIKSREEGRPIGHDEAKEAFGPVLGATYDQSKKAFAPASGWGV